MSQKKKPQQQHDAASPVPQPEAPPVATERVRRILLGLVTALVVARPLVLGEDPGMLSPHTDTSNLVLTLLWFLTAFAWAIWRWWANSTAWHGGVVEAALLVASIFVSISSAAASYKHPAILIAWEWFALFLGLFLMRQLAASATDRRYLIAVFLASTVSLSAYAVFQTRVEFPALRENPSLRSNPRLELSPRQAAGLCGSGAGGPLFTTGLLYRIAAEQADTREGDQTAEIVRRLEQGHAFATFTHPSSFAGYLVLFLPVLAAAAFLRARQSPGSWETPVSLACVLLGGVALLLTGSGQGGILGLAVAAWTAFFVARRKVGPARVLVLLATGFAVFAAVQMRQGSGSWSETWTSAWAMIRAHPWLGVGAGNFGRNQPHYLPEGASTIADEPSNFALELWATSGIFALLAVLVALGAFFWSVLRPSTADEGQSSKDAEVQSTTEAATAKAAEEVPPSSAVPGPTEGREPPRWEFYLWSIAGMLLAFVLNRIGQSPEELMQQAPSEHDLFIQAVVTVFRAIIWFGAFALFEGVVWPGRTLSAALAIGVCGLLGQLCFSGGIGFPSVAGPLWLAAGLALAGLERKPHTAHPNSWLAAVAPLPLVIGFLIAFVRSTFDPVTTGMNQARSSVLAFRLFAEDSASKTPKIRDQRKFLADRVARPLREAVREDPGEVRWLLALSRRSAQFWQIHWDASRRGRSAQDRKEIREFADEALVAVKKAQRLDPEGTQAFRAEFELWRMLASRQLKKEDLQRFLKNAAAVLEQEILRDETNPWTHYLLAQTWTEAGETIKARDAAETALYWDDRAVRTPRKLNGWQRHYLEQLAGPEP